MRRTASKLMVNWVASFVSVILLLSMMALPALAVVAANTVNSAAIINGQVRTPDLAGDAVTSAKIKNGQVKRPDIALGAVVSGRIADGAVTTAKIRNGHVRSADIAAGAVRSGKIANDAVTSAKIRNGSVNGADIANGSITNADIASGAAISDSKISYTTKTATKIILAPDFNPNGGSSVIASTNLLYGGAAGSQGFHTAVFLPDGAVVTKVRAYLMDNTASHTNNMKLARRAFGEVSEQTLASVATVDNISWQTLTDTGINYATVDNANYGLFVYGSVYGTSSVTSAFGMFEITYQYSPPQH